MVVVLSFVAGCPVTIDALIENLEMVQLWSIMGIPLASCILAEASEIPSSTWQSKFRSILLGFHRGDTNSDGTLSKDEFQTLAEPLGWDAHLRRRDFHYIGLFLHLWAAEDGGLFHQIDDSSLAVAIVCNRTIML